MPSTAFLPIVPVSSRHVTPQLSDNHVCVCAKLGNKAKPGDAANEPPRRRRGRPKKVQKPVSASKDSKVGSQNATSPRPKRGPPKKATSELESLGSAEPADAFVGEAMAEQRRASRKAPSARPRSAMSKKGLEKSVKPVAASQRDFRQMVVSLARDGFNGQGNDRSFLNELLPLLAKREAEESLEGAGLDEADEDAQVRMLANTVRNQDLSLHRRSGSYKTLRPFSLRDAEMVKCGRCSGTGMMVCEFCKGEGCVPLEACGEPGSIVEFNGSTAIVPDISDVVDTCLCPFCGGLTEERCVECFGEGQVDRVDTSKTAQSGQKKKVPGATTYCADAPALDEASKEKFIEEHADRVEIGIDGTVILRARKRGPKKSVKSRAQSGSAKPGERTKGGRPPPASTKRKRRRGRPRKGESPEDEMEPLLDVDARVWADQLRTGMGMGPTSRPISTGRGLPTRRSTDFVNTTAYQFMRKDGPGLNQKASSAFTEELDEQQRLAQSRDESESQEDDEKEPEDI